METFQTCNGPTVEEVLREEQNGNIQESRLPRIILNGRFEYEKNVNVNSSVA